MTITNSTQNVLAYGWNGTNPVRMEVNASGHQKVNVENAISINTAGLATDTAQATGNGHLSAIQTAVQGTLTVDGSATTQPVSGSVSVSNFPATQPVSGSVSVSNNTDPSTGTKQDAQTSLLSTVAGAVSGTEMQVDIVSGSVSVSNNTDPATATKQDAQLTQLSTIAGAVSGTEMQVDIVSGSVSVSNNTDPATATKQDAQTSVLSSVDGKITACDTGAVVVSSSALPSGASTSANQLAGNSSLTALEGSLYADGDAFGVSDVGVMMMGRNGTSVAKPIHITANGDVEVEIADFVKGQTTMSASFPVVVASDQSDMNIKINAVSQTGTYQNLQAGTSLTAGSDTTAVDITNVKHVNIVYEDTATSSFDGLDVLVSGNGGTNYNIVSQLYPTTNAAGTLRYAYISLEVGGLDFIKLQNNSSTDTYTAVNASAFGSL